MECVGKSFWFSTQFSSNKVSSFSIIFINTFIIVKDWWWYKWNSEFFKWIPVESKIRSIIWIFKFFETTFDRLISTFTLIICIKIFSWNVWNFFSDIKELEPSSFGSECLPVYFGFMNIITKIISILFKSIIKEFEVTIMSSMWLFSQIKTFSKWKLSQYITSIVDTRNSLFHALY